MKESLGCPEPVRAITPEMDRRNGGIFIWTQLLIYLAAPVIYVGVVQAAYCDRLGASATIANLPVSAYLAGAIAPFFCAWFFPPVRDKPLVVSSFHLLGVSLLIVCLSIFLPLSNAARIAVIIGQGFIAGFVTNISNVYMFRCLARGTTEAGRARALKYAFGFGPIAAVVGSMTAQYLLAGRVRAVPYPCNVGLIYLAASPCMIICGVLSERYQLGAAPPEDRVSFGQYLGQIRRAFAQDHRLALVWFGFLAWYFTLNSMSNLSLYSWDATGRAPLELAGLIMALRFGGKALAGFGLGSLAAHRGAVAPMVATVLLVGAAIVWPFITSGYSYLFAFGLMGAGELGGVYFMNYVIAISSPLTTTRNLALMTLTSPLSGLAPPIYGMVTDRFGFHASFVVGIATALASLALIARAKSNT